MSRDLSDHHWCSLANWQHFEGSLGCTGTHSAPLDVTQQFILHGWLKGGKKLLKKSIWVFIGNAN